MITVLAPGELSVVQDLGRPGLAGLGVSPSGAADRRALIAGNRALGHPDGGACLELTGGGLAVRAEASVLVMLTGAEAPISLDGEPAPHGRVLDLAQGSVLRVGAPRWGLRTYLCVRGGFDVPPVLGSRSHDALSGLGPAPLAEGDVLPIGEARGSLATMDAQGRVPPSEIVAMLDALPGPRLDWFTPAAQAALFAEPYEVTHLGDRVGVRLRGAALERAIHGELASEGVMAGAIQVPADGQPLIFGPDHPVTGGYPVIAVLTEAARDASAQMRPGQQIRFRRASGWPA